MYHVYLSTPTFEQIDVVIFSLEGVCVCVCVSVYMYDNMYMYT